MIDIPGVHPRKRSEQNPAFRRGIGGHGHAAAGSKEIAGRHGKRVQRPRNGIRIRRKHCLCRAPAVHGQARHETPAKPGAAADGRDRPWEVQTNSLHKRTNNPGSLFSDGHASMIACFTRLSVLPVSRYRFINTWLSFVLIHASAKISAIAATRSTPLRRALSRPARGLFPVWIRRRRRR